MWSDSVPSETLMEVSWSILPSQIVFKNKRITWVLLCSSLCQSTMAQNNPLSTFLCFSAVQEEESREEEWNLYIKSSSGKMLGFHSWRAANGAISADDKSSRSRSGNEEASGVTWFWPVTRVTRWWTAALKKCKVVFQLLVVSCNMCFYASVAHYYSKNGYK